MTFDRFETMVLMALLLLTVVIGLWPADAGEPRSPEWRNVRDAYIALHPDCEWCGMKGEQVHHVQPFHLHPELELDTANLVTLCQSCHKRAHLGNWQSWDPLLREEIARYRERVKARPSTAEEAEAFRQRHNERNEHAPAVD